MSPARVRAITQDNNRLLNQDSIGTSNALD
jgi:hypothetical protein